MSTYLNIANSHDRDKKIVCLSQEKYIQEMINEFEIPIDKLIRTPMQENLKLVATEEENTTPKQLQYVAKFP